MPDTKRTAMSGVALGLLVALAVPASGETVTDLSDGRSGRIVFESETPSGPTEFLAGQAPSSIINGDLVFPDQFDSASEARVPAMVISHGSGGILADREPMWAERLRKQGVATFLVDSFAPRGIASTGADQSRLPLAASIADALHALQLLSTHPRIDPRRIGIIGFSKGGQVALYTALEPFREAVMGNDGERFALHIALYASCSIPYKGAPVSDAPILLLLGGADDYTPSAHCGRYADWLREHGGNVDMTIIENGHHGFDLSTRPRYLRRAQSARDCGMDILLNPVEGQLWGSEQVLQGEEIDSYLRGCMQRGGTVGGNPAALAQAVDEVETAVSRFLSQ